MSSTKKIKWNPAHSGELELTTRSCYLDSLLDLGAVYHGASITGLPTDRAGKRVIRQRAHDALRGIHEAVESIGWLMAYADIKEIPEHRLSSLGWTLAGLSGLGRDLMSIAEMATAPEEGDDETP